MSDDINIESKIEILKTVITERYAAVHTIRSRVQEISLWSTGLLVAASGWLFQSETLLEDSEKIVLVVFIGGAYLILRYVYFADLEDGFTGQQQTLAKVEKALRLYTPGFFTDDGSSLYPESWSKAGTTGGEGKFFRTNYALLQFGIFAFVSAVLLNGCL